MNCSPTINSTINDTTLDCEWQPTPQVKDKLLALNTFLHSISDGKIEPVRFQLHQPINEVASSTRSYIKSKFKEISQAVLDCIAPGQSDKWKLLTEEKKSQDDSQGDEKIDTLLKLYDASSSWYTKEIFYQYLLPIIPNVNCKPCYLVFRCGESIVLDHTQTALPMGQ
jgi:hypothetical protein